MKRRHCIFLLAGCIRNEPRRGAVCYWQLLNPPRTRSSDAHLRAMVMHRMVHAAGSVRADGRGSGPGSGLARTKHSIQKTIQFNSNVMGPRRGRGRTALSTPTTPPVQRSINSCTTATNDKRRGRLIYFIRSHHLPAISCPPWTPLIYFEWTNISDAHPFPHRLSPADQDHLSPQEEGTDRARDAREAVWDQGTLPRFEKPGEAGGHGWRITIFESRRSFGTPTDFRRAWGGPFNSNIGKSGPLREDKFYPDPKTNINSGPMTQLFPPLVPRHAKFGGLENIFFVAHRRQGHFPASFFGMIVPPVQIFGAKTK